MKLWNLRKDKWVKLEYGIVELQKGKNLRTKRQIRKLKAKMGFHVLAKHGLNKHGLKDQNWSHLEERKTVRGRRRRASKAKLQKDMELLTLSMELGFLVWILGFVWLKVCPKPRV